MPLAKAKNANLEICGIALHTTVCRSVA